MIFLSMFELLTLLLWLLTWVVAQQLDAAFTAEVRVDVTLVLPDCGAPIGFVAIFAGCS